MRRSGRALADDVLTLFDDYAARWARGEAPDAREYLARAGDGRDELAELLDRFLASAPPGEPGAGARGELRRLGRRRAAAPRAAREPRRAPGRGRGGDRRALPSSAGKRAKVARYVHRLETGLLDPRGVDRGVLEAWAGVLRARVEDLLAWRPPPAPAASVKFFRAAEPSADTAAFSLHAPADECDEVDELFTGRELTWDNGTGLGRTGARSARRGSTAALPRAIRRIAPAARAGRSRSPKTSSA